jgi:leukemia factor-related protein
VCEDVCIVTSLFHVAGKAVNKEGGPEEKKDDGEVWCNVEAQAAFLGPNLWDKTLPYDSDLKVRTHSLAC